MIRNMNRSIETDIKLIKFKHYIARHPQKAFGYYCLAKLYMEWGSFGIPEELLKKAQSIGRPFVPAIIGLIGVYANQGRFLKAAMLYDKNRHILESKEIYKSRTARAVTSIYDSQPALIRRGKNIALLKLLTSFSRKEPNPVAALLIAMHGIAGGVRNEKALALYRMILNMKGITDNFRWHLLKTLARNKPSLYKSRDTASLFSGIPKGCSFEYADTIFSAILDSGNHTRIPRIFNELCKKNHPISPPNLWKLLVWSKGQSDLDDNMVFECCRHLIKAGWLDRIVAGAMIELHRYKGFNLTQKEASMLELFGYQ
jgi:tetratricopeptide (TPR) repeat protein